MSTPIRRHEVEEYSSHQLNIATIATAAMRSMSTRIRRQEVEEYSSHQLNTDSPE